MLLNEGDSVLVDDADSDVVSDVSSSIDNSTGHLPDDWGNDAGYMDKGYRDFSAYRNI